MYAAIDMTLGDILLRMREVCCCGKNVMVHD